MSEKGEEVEVDVKKEIEKLKSEEEIQSNK